MRARFCIHGHFYQPAREHPWLETVEIEASAAPAHDWNERVTAECYAPNAAARILDGAGQIVRIVNNYERISFNVGPTLLRWLERAAPDTYAAILRADRASAAALGHGNAIAQAYNHVIMPLASRRDKITQVRWGIADFRRRFDRPPDGMWLPETAVDLETLTVLADCGIRFTILAPHQAARTRAPGGDWVDATPTGLDITRPYLCRPAPGRQIALFFYHGAVSQEIAFQGLLESGEVLARRLLDLAGGPHEGAGLIHVATDGETYGHHHRFGEMALAYAVDALERRTGARMTNYAAFLAAHPLTHEVRIHERTSWSCAHGIERWRANCGCRTRGDWHQRWRGPLRDALDWLKGEVDALFEEAGASVLHDPWAARDAYIDVVLDRSDATVARFLAAHARRPGEPGAAPTTLRLLEMQRHAMLMFTSDGWFFDDVAGLETVQILSHAARVLQLAAVGGRDLERPFLDRLARAEGNVAAYPNGAAVYDRLVRPKVVDHRRVAAHAAIMSLFEDLPSDGAVYAFQVARRQERRLAREPHTLLTGRAEVMATATAEPETVSFAALHFGGPDVHCCVAAGWDDGAHAEAADALVRTYETGAVAEVVREMDARFGREFYTVRDLFTEQRRAVLAHLSAEALTDLEAAYRRLYQENRGLMTTMRDADVPVPQEFLAAAAFVTVTDLRRALDAPHPLPAAVWDLINDARTWNLALPAVDLEPHIRARIERHLLAAEGLFVVDDLGEVERTLDLAQEVGITPNLWQAQNLFATRLAPRIADALPKARRALERVAARLHFSEEAKYTQL